MQDSACNCIFQTIDGIFVNSSMQVKNICLYFDFEFSSCMAHSKARVNTPCSCISYKVMAINNFFFVNINLGEEMARLPSPDLSSNYAYDLGFQPTLERA